MKRANKTNPKKDFLTDYIIHYLENRPAFFSLIRPQEGYLFQHNNSLIQSPILDFGCGDGFFADMVFDKNSIDVGLDVSNSRIQEAEMLHVYKKRISYDGGTIPLKSKSFQTVISNCVLEHIPTIQQSVNEVARVLKPGGHFLTGVMTNNWERFQFGPYFFGNYYKKRMRKQQEHFNLFSTKKWDSVFAGAGLTVVSRTGYISPKNARWLDIFHYFSIPSLISHALIKKWVAFPGWHTLIPVTGFIHKLTQESIEQNDLKRSSAVFYTLRK